LNSFLQDLNDQQKEAVLYNKGPLLVFAGAGSGKTKVITYKIAYLVEELYVSPSHIFAVTFTNKAANEMKERVEALIGERIKGLWIGTFHSLCARILRREIPILGYEKNFTILDEDDSIRIIKDATKSADFDIKYFEPKKIKHYISNIKRSMISAKEFANMPHEYFESVVSSIYLKYEKLLRENNALDFDDLIMLTVRLLKGHPDVAFYYKDKFKYVLVDEYQDVNKSQYELLKILSSKYKNITVVGDDDQSIYSFRGADSALIFKFQEDYPDAKTVKLEKNYRSPQEILDVANELISHNAERSGKELYSTKKTHNSVNLYEAADEIDEARFVVKKIKELRKEEGKHFSDFAILYRMNFQSRIFEEYLIEEGIPYQIIGGVRFYSRAEIKDMMAYLSVINNPRDDISFKRIINVPLRKIGPATLRKIEEVKEQSGLTLYESLEYLAEKGELSGGYKKLEDFYNLIKELKEDARVMSIRQLVEEIISKTQYYNYLMSRGKGEGEARIENVKEFINVVSEFIKTSEDTSLSAFLTHLSLITDIDTSKEGNRATLMTLHAAKGLEFPVVFLVGLEEGFLPHYRAFESNKELEEERRLCYVGITRAKERVFFTYAYRRSRYGVSTPTKPSRFLSEIPIESVENEHREVTSGIELHVSDKVLHRVWGVGKVDEVHTETDVPYAVIDFIKIGKKKLDLRYAPIERLE
jgi:DNA helicase-2/ATP-dependent DNA helicase PcrA